MFDIDFIDLLGVPDKDVWAYGETLRALAVEKAYSHISFSRLRDLVTISLPEQVDEMTYVANASNFRRALLNTFSRPDWDWKEVSQSEDVCLTYRGYIKFLETDLQYVYPQGPDRSKSKYKRGIEYIAKQMLARGDVSHHQHIRDWNSNTVRHLRVQFNKSTKTTFACLFTHRRGAQSYPLARCPQHPSIPPRGTAAWPLCLTAQ